MLTPMAQATPPAQQAAAAPLPTPAAPPTHNFGIPMSANSADFLFKLATQRKMTQPVFEQLAEQGPPHMRVFICQCTFNNLTAQGQGRSKKEAKSASARALQAHLTPENLPPDRSSDALEKKQRRAEEKKRKAEDGLADGAHPAQRKKYDFQRHQQMMERQRAMAFQGLDMGGMGPPAGFFMGGPPGPEWMGGPMFGGPPFMPDGMPVPPSRRGGGRQRTQMGRQFKLTLDDHYMMTKHKEIFPGPQEIESIMKLVEHTEKALQKTAEVLKDSPNKIECTSRIGDLSKGLLLASDRSVDLVLLCKWTPGISLLKQVTEDMVKQLKEVAPGNKYRMLVSAKNSGFSVTAQPEDMVVEGEDKEKKAADKAAGPYVVNITLTSLIMKTKDQVEGEEKRRKEEKERAEEEKKKAEEEKDKVGAAAEATAKATPEKNGAVAKEVKEEEEKEIIPTDPLPRAKCLEALSELRHARWFETMVMPLPSGVECIRIVKNMRSRDPAWAMLSSWAVEQLVERALYSAGHPKPPAKALMRILEAVSSGLFLPDGPGLKDPCQVRDVDVAENLSAQQREDLTMSAQRMLRQIVFRKIYVVLGMDQLPSKEERLKKQFEEREARRKARQAEEEAKKAEDAAAPAAAPAAAT